MIYFTDDATRVNSSIFSTTSSSWESCGADPGADVQRHDTPRTGHQSITRQAQRDTDTLAFTAMGDFVSQIHFKRLFFCEDNVEKIHECKERTR